MKEELLEAIYGTVERLEQKVDELSVSTKNAGAETVPASNDITKLDKSINAMFIKEEEVRGKISKLRVVTHRFEPTSKSVLLFIGGLALSLVISIWGNLTQWREHQDWEEADLKYRALKMVLSADDPNILYIEKHFSVNRDENVIDYVKNRVAAYEDSVLKYNEMVRMAAYKDSVANELLRESNSIKRTIKNYQ